jgi:uncharacterized protein (TIGR03435 family)
MRDSTSSRAKTSLLPVIAMLIGAAASAQQDTSALRFDVVSIKRGAVDAETLAGMTKTGGTCGLPFVERTSGRVSIPATELCGLIRVAYDVGDYQVTGIPPALAKGIVENTFEIDARVQGAATPSPEDTRLMLQTMLAERFRLRVHREPREMPVYVLVTAKGGPKLTPCSSPDAGSFYTPGVLVSCTPPMPMTRILQMLTREVRRPVVNKTTLTGPVAFELHWLPEGASAQPQSPPGLFTAIQEQLGLRLQPDRAPIDSIIVDHAEAPSAN